MEVIVAIGVAGIGVMSMISLVYTIVAPGRDVMVQTRVGVVASDITAWFTNRIESDWAGWVDVTNGTFTLPVESGGVFNRDVLFDALTDPGWTASGAPGLFAHASRPGLYKTAFDESTDFSVRIWQAPIVNDTLTNVGTTDTHTVDDDIGVTVFMEISYPFSKPYLERKRWYFTVTILNPES